jgi:Ca2+-transporting ATPase
MGRRIYDHLRKAMTYIIAVHVPIAGMSLIPVLLSGAPLALSPVHILFLELVIDPACSIVFEAEPENPDLMRRPPRSPAAPLFGAGMLLLGLAQGLSVLTGVLVVYLLGWLGGLSAGETTALSFVTLTLSNLGLIFVNRSWTRSIVSTLRVPNPALWAVCGATLFFLALVLFTPGLRGLFHFTPTAPARYLVCVAASILSLAWFEGLKRVWRWKKPG